MGERLPARQAAAYLGIPKRSIYELPIPRYALSPRRTVWAIADLDSYLQSCRVISTKPDPAGALSLTGSLVDAGAALRSCFKRAGAENEHSQTLH